MKDTPQSLLWLASYYYRIKRMKLLRKNKLYIAYAFCIILVIGLLAILENTSHEKLLTGGKDNVASSTVVDLDPDMEEEEEKPSPLYQYIEVTDSCGTAYDGVCVNVRSKPSTDAPAVFKARNGMVLKVKGKVEGGGREWYRITFDEWLRYPERVTGEMYIAADFVTPFVDEGNVEITKLTKKTDKRIIVDRSEQKLYAYEGDVLFMEEAASTGLDTTPTPRGTFTVFKKRPSRYMQGPIPEISQKYYDLPGVPWNLYFTEQGAIIHGAYWHEHFGEQWSNGCVNLPMDKAEKLYKWADVGTKVTVRD